MMNKSSSRTKLSSKSYMTTPLNRTKVIDYTVLLLIAYISPEMKSIESK